MWGAIIGDLAGSIYEYGQYKRTSTIRKVDTLIGKESFFSDDTILTIAIYDAILHNKNYEEYLKKYGNRFLNYQPDTTIQSHFHTTFGPGFVKWLEGKNDGTSIGNGAMMRISGVGFMFDDVIEVTRNAREATIPSHNSVEAIECATKIALIIHYAKQGMNKQNILKYTGIGVLSYTHFSHFNQTCYETIDNCIYATFTSHRFEEAVKKVIGYGGDTDTNACIVGAMAEALYGVPSHLISLARAKLPDDFVKILDQAYSMKN